MPKFNTDSSTADERIASKPQGPSRFISKAQRDDPCEREGLEALDCRVKTKERGYDFHMFCWAPITNAKNCKSFWEEVEKQRRAAYIEPIVPSKEERPLILDRNVVALEERQRKLMEEVEQKRNKPIPLFR